MKTESGSKVGSIPGCTGKLEDQEVGKLFQKHTGVLVNNECRGPGNLESGPGLFLICVS